MQKLASSLLDARVDLNPHQVEAALFAFHSPLSKGAILADEVGLGKTIEAGLVISQKWAERKRKILVIVPSNLRQQWNQELLDKFFLSSLILETSSFNQGIKKGNLNPFDQNEVIICSYHFARSKDAYIRNINWDLVVIDEAHRLRNVYKPRNKIANAVKNAVAHAPKILLTATPLQNSLLELYGLVSVIDDYTFGDLKSFKSQFSRLANENDFYSLKERLKPVCIRTLRHQVLEYVKYTNRIAITQEFIPSSDEQKLYDLVSAYLQREDLFALPPGQRQLMTLILRKLLASSTFAISGTLEALADKLENIVKRQKQLDGEVERSIAQNFETFDELKDEWLEDEEEPQSLPDEQGKQYSPEEIRNMQQEIYDLREFERLAKSIARNSKGNVLLTALKKGFAETERLGGSKKAIIFTESTRTQEYLKNILENTEFKGKIVLFNGSNNDSKSREIYQRWLEKHKDTDAITDSKTANLRAAIVDHFKDEAVIMIATEAAAEGINLQFCSLVVNYDLPWNPQRVEQRVGRCHRYGQKFDVIVVNFLNKNNAADQRVYQILDEKSRLFSGVFGASDEVLGSIESGVDFEKRIAQIYQNCRTPEEIQFSFDQLQKELEEHIEDRMKTARQKLLENFDEEVHEKLKVSLCESREYLTRYENWLWQITKYYLAPYADFVTNEYSFTLRENPFAGEKIHPGPYRLGRNIEDVNVYRIGHPLAQRIIEQCKSFQDEAPLNSQSGLIFNYSDSSTRISILEPFVGKSGYLSVINLTIHSFETEDHVLLCGITDEGLEIDAEQCRRLFSLPATISPFPGNKPTPCPSQEGNKTGISHEGNKHTSNPLVRQSAHDEGLRVERKSFLSGVERKSPLLGGDLGVGNMEGEFGSYYHVMSHIAQMAQKQQAEILQMNAERNAGFFDTEMEKLDTWAEDVKSSMEIELKELDKEIKCRKTEAKKILNLEEKVTAHRQVKEMEKKRNTMRLNLYQTQDDVDNKKEQLIGEIEARLKQKIETTELFTVRWKVI
ncbi:RNA polymerase-associated protein RapA [Candidatus Brocadiaceae bacterium B188]|nr:RNA polymerase-associated protein RapA [Candidatus Brocadiaceae bacterium B188]